MVLTSTQPQTSSSSSIATEKLVDHEAESKLNGSEQLNGNSGKMGVPKDKSDEPVVQTNGKQVANQETNGDASSTTPAASNGHVTPTEELNDFSRQINIDTKPPANVFGIDDADATEDAPPQVSPLIFSSPEASSSSTVPDPPPLPALEYPSSSSSTGYSSSSTLRLKPETSSQGPKFVGLVNQAMTCYLNSLLQALYMTPEFRNAMYNWEFDGQDESKSIPYQLQRLFLNLQTSPKAAVETTDLTRSFGWDSSEAWQQHDIQELCRVMFDALEHKFKGTKEADLINRLYEGKMIDYLKCLSCGTERTREDTFLDIPLPVKPFGSTVAFGSIEEALRAFIQPEILNGNNQYSCGKCEKKCDAHKGLKFSRFPYILTLHLKRFDFDYQTFHRIKLNDKVTFPQTLNLNGFLNTATDFGHCNGDSADTNGTTNENGKVSEEDGQDETDEKHNGHTPMEVDDPEENPHNPETNGKSFEEAQAKSTFGSHSGPYMYELFAIMIHSGSASGGHYYVYIKDFESGNWLSFNDQCVSPITQEDIQKSFGGNAGRFHYSSAYTTSTNAYMLMYRQVDPARNAQFVSVDAFPEHIKTLQKKLKDRQELDTRRRTTTTATSITDYSVITTRVYHYDRERCTLTDVKIHISGDYYMDELLQRAYDRSLVSLRSLNCCRLVAFDSKTEQTLASIDQQDSTLLQDVLDKYTRCDFLLEERERDETFRSYTSPMLNARIYIVDIKTNDVEGPFRVPVTLSGTVADMKQEIRETMKNRCVGELRVALLKSNFAVILDNEKDVLKNEIDPSELCPVKLFVAHFPEAAKSRVQLFDKQLKKIAEKFDRVVSLYFKVPVVTAEIRNRHSIPDYIPPTPSPSQVRQETVPTVVEASVVEPPIVEPSVVEPPVVVKVEDEENSVSVPMEVCSESLDVKALSPETTISETTQSSSPSPEPGEPKERGASTTGTVKLVKKKSLTPKSSPGDGEKLDATKTKEKSPGTIRETVETKEVTVNGVTKKVRVVKRIVKKDPSKKVVNAETATNGVEAPPPSEAAAPEKSTTPTKVVKKAKVASKLAPKAVEAKATATAESVTVEIPKPLPKTELNKQKSPTPEVTVKLPAPSAEVSLTLPAPTVDGFAFLDKLADGEDAVSGGAAVQYFRAISKKKPSEQNGSNADDESNVIQVHVDKNMTISALTMNLEPVIQVSKDYFKINKSRTDTLRLHESVSGLA